MSLKKIFYKLTGKKKYQSLKSKLTEDNRIKVLKSGFEKKINDIREKLQKKEISFLHSGHLGDVINALPVLKELSKNHKCSLFLQVGKPLEEHIKGYKHEGDEIYMTKKMVDLVMPLLKNQNYLDKVEEYNDQSVDVDLDLFRKIPMNFNLDEIRWYFHLTGVHTDLSMQ